MTQTTIKDKPSIKKVAVVFAVAMIMIQCCIPMNYISYAYTDLAYIPVNLTGISNVIVTIIGWIVALTIGAFISKSHSRFGQCRPFMFGGYIVLVVGATIMFAAGIGGGVILKTIVITIGFGLQTIGNGIFLAAVYGLERIIAGPDSDARTLISSRFFLGLSGGLVLNSLVVIPLAEFFGGGIKGYTFMQIALGVLGLIGMIMILSVSKSFDTPQNITEAEPEEDVKFIDMLKSAVINKPAMILLIADTMRMTGYCTWIALIVYQCKYVIGDMNSMIIVLTAANICAIFGAYLSFPATLVLGGRKKTVIIACIFAAATFLAVGMFGNTLWGFVIPACIGCFFMSFFDSIAPMLYADAGEYWLHEKGQDTRIYLTSLAAVPLQLAMILSSVAFTGVLFVIHYVPDQPMDAAMENTLTWSVGLIPAIGYAIAMILLAFAHGVSDKEMARFCSENEERGA